MLANAFARVRTTPQPDTYATIDSPPPVEYKEEDETVDHVASASSRLPGHQRRLSLSLNLVQGGSPLLAPPSPKLGNFGAAARPTTRYFVLAVIALAVSAASFLLAGHSGASPGTCRIDNSIERQFGRWNVKLSRAHEGSGYRMKRFWEKVERGEAVNVAVLGGSVSTGHGAIGKHLYQYGAIPADQIWHAVVGKWLNDTVGADRVRFVSGSAGGMDSGFFSWCWPAKIGESPDLVFLESAVNDVYGSLDGAENLLRSLLLLPGLPAVVYVDSFSKTSGAGEPSMLNAGDSHIALAMYYDVPQISARGPLLPAMLRNSTLQDPYFQGDPRHIAQPLHDFLGKMVIAYLQETRCAAPSTTGTVSSNFVNSELWPDSSSLALVPPLKLTDPYNSNKTYPLVTVPPTCSIAGEGLTPSRPSPGWELFTWKIQKSYLETTTAGAEIAFSVEVREGAIGDVAVSYFRSRQYDLGKVTCSVGDQSVEVDGHWEQAESVPQIQVVARVSPGVHEIVCRTPADSTKLVRIVAAMSM